MKKRPEQTAQTRQTIMDAFWELSKRYGIERVTVSAVTKKAMLNRGTFYVYFTDLEDLLCQAEDEILRDLFEQMTAALSDGIPSDLDAASIKVLETLCRYDEKLFLLLGRSGNPSFLARLREEAGKLFPLVFQSDLNTSYKEYIIAYVTAAFTGLLSYWHESGRQIHIEEVAMISRNMTTRGLAGLTGFAPMESHSK